MGELIVVCARCQNPHCCKCEEYWPSLMAKIKTDQSGRPGGKRLSTLYPDGRPKDPYPDPGPPFEKSI